MEDYENVPKNIDMSRFINTEDQYDFNYFKERFSYFEDTIIDLIVKISREKVVVCNKKETKEDKKNANCVTMKKENVTITFD
jgi:hypothetical protein